MFSGVIGESAALSAAFLWALSAVIYRRLGVSLPPIALNLYKGGIAVALLLVTVAWTQPGAFRTVDGYGAALLLLSGIIGIGIGDTAFFAALNRLGERLTVLLAETLAPPISAVIALVFIGETLDAGSLVGIAVTLCGVALVIGKLPVGGRVAPFHQREGFLLAALAASAQAVGAVLSREALTQTDISPLMSALLRLTGGVLILVLWLAIGRRRFSVDAMRSGRVAAAVVTAAFLGTYLGLFLQQVSLKYADTGVALTLLATSSLFVLPLVFLRGERIGPRALVGAVTAIVGVGMLFGAFGETL
ncbi:MAG: EamA family transporter [Pseudomonadota bacterium]